MFQTYLKSILRNLSNHRTYTFINITGLALGMFCCLLIMLWVQDELNFDKFHKKGEHLYMLVHQQDNGDWWTSSPWAISPILKEDFPEIEKASRLSTQQLTVKYKEHNFHETIAFVDPEFLEMFNFPLLEGDSSLALREKQSVIISQQAAQKYFHTEDPVGKNLQIDQKMNLTVTGILKDIPSNSSIKFDMIVPIENLGDEVLKSWSSEVPAFVLLQENADVENLRAKMAGTQSKYDKRMDNSKIVNDLYLFSRLNLYGFEGGGSIVFVYIFSIIGLIVLIIACINFINLFTAKASMRSREIGMRKIFGASKAQIIRQLYSETFLLAVFSFILAVSLVIIVLPDFNAFTGKGINLKFTNNPALIIGSVFLIVLTALLAGSYPAFLFSSTSPIKTLKEPRTGLKKSPMRRTLLVVQFSISIILMVMAITMNQQLDYIQNKNLGFKREQVISLSINQDLQKQLEPFKEHLLQQPGITNVTSGSNSPNDINSANPTYWEGRGPGQYVSMNYVVVDYDYLPTFEIALLEGRNFSKDFSTDRQNYIVNEAAIKFMQMDEPIGKMFSVWESEGEIIGVVKNFHSSSLHNGIGPVVMTLLPSIPPSQVFIRVKPDNIHASLASIEESWKEFMPDHPFNYEFLDDAFRRQYIIEEKAKALFINFSLMAIFISCIGLFGLATFISQRRVKEIGIRRANGAGIYEVLLMLNKDFIKWVVLSFVIAVPVAWFAMSEWLSMYAYKTELSWWIFGLAGLLALGVALLTVSWQSWRAATRNPVEALRYE